MAWKYSHLFVYWCVFFTLPLWLPLVWLVILVELVKTIGSANPSSRASSRSDRLGMPFW